MPFFNVGKKSSKEEYDKFDYTELSFPFLIDDSFALPVKKAKPKPDEEEPATDTASADEALKETEEETEAETAVSNEAESEEVSAEVSSNEETEEILLVTEEESEPIPEPTAFAEVDAEEEIPAEEISATEEPAAKEVPVTEEKTDNFKEPENAAPKMSAPSFSPFNVAAPARSPLQSVLTSVMNTAGTVKEETPVTVKEEPKETKPEIKKEETSSNPEKKENSKVMLKPEVIIEPETADSAPVVKTSTLLAKCMPYIYDDDGVNYVEEKPNYTLESVEDIISSVEKKANERIAKMYGIKPSDADGAKTDDFKAPKREEKPKVEIKPKTPAQPTVTKIGQEVKPTSVFDTTSFPKVSDTLFDDFSSRRTEMSDTGPITTTYTQFNNMHSDAEEGHTRVIPDLKLDGTAEIFEDISSHSAATGTTTELPRFSHKPDIDYAPDEVAENPDIDEFGGAEDIRRVGGELKFNMLACRLRMISSAVLTLFAGIMHIPPVKDFLMRTPLFAEIAGLVVFGLAVIFNLNVFASIKSAFSKQMKIELPLAIALIFMGGYLVFGAFSSIYVFDVIILPLISLLIYTFCSYLKHNAIWNNFKIVASRTPKKAVALISEPSTTSAMARSIIEGDILAAGSQETDEIGDFLKNSFADRPFQGRITTFTIASLITSLVIAVVIGISHASFSDAFCAAASVLCLAAAPSLFVADMLPFAGLSRRLSPLKAAVCSKFSAERIELLNAVVLTSADIFPDDCIKLYSMRPLSSNNLDETIAFAAAVANEANSPLKNLFLNMLAIGTKLPEADSVKYEDNLGISGWADDHHIMIGNRSIMEAHGVRVPALEVDRKILHKGFFPVYVACDQRACALLTVKYTIDREVEYELGRLSDKGVTLLVDNCDPNITEEMLCDYYSLFPDLVKILDHHGVGKYKNAVSPAEKVSAHGFYKDSALGFVSLINGCIRLRTASNALGIVHIIVAVLCWLVYTGISVGGTMALIGGGLAALCSLATLVISLVTYFTLKP